MFANELGRETFSPLPRLWAPHYLGPKRLAQGQQALAPGPCPVPARPVGATGIPLPTRCTSVSVESLT